MNFNEMTVAYRVAVSNGAIVFGYYATLAEAIDAARKQAETFSHYSHYQTWEIRQYTDLTPDPRVFEIVYSSTEEGAHR